MTGIRAMCALALIGITGNAHAQEAVRYLGAFDTVGSDVSVTPLSDTQLEFCWTTTSRQSSCQTFAYRLEAGKAFFSSADDGEFAFDLVTNVLTQKRPDGVTKTADMTPVAR